MSVNLTISKFNICDIVMSVDEVGRELGGTPSELATLLITSLLGQSQGLERSVLKGLHPSHCIERNPLDSKENYLLVLDYYYVMEDVD
jgi:hypothetical protein